MLTAERTALNFLQRLSGIATLTRRFVDAAGGRITVLDTRKTTPTLRALEKYAVRAGGGTNHRFGLEDGDPDQGQPHPARRRRRSGGGADEGGGLDLPIEIEAQSLDQVDAALAAGADIILLDNLSIEETREAVRRIAGRAKVEISGGVTLERMPELAATGADYVSIGALDAFRPRGRPELRARAGCLKRFRQSSPRPWNRPRWRVDMSAPRSTTSRKSVPPTTKPRGLPSVARLKAPRSSPRAQTAGRGRFGRTWFSPPGAGLYVSVICRDPRAAPSLSLAGRRRGSRGHSRRHRSTRRDQVAERHRHRCRARPAAQARRDPRRGIVVARRVAARHPRVRDQPASGRLSA